MKLRPRTGFMRCRGCGGYIVDQADHIECRAEMDRARRHYTDRPPDDYPERDER